ncbi:MAG TPA: phosphoglycerate dehydrogenase [Terriglobia bacterium]|nr:phosphoglycerate dehydrogenase [Terriglobia bacterium]
MKALFLESIHEAAAVPFVKDGYEVKTLQGSLDESALIEEVKDVEVLGIRSKTRVTARVLDAAPRLLVVGAFCIGTDQIELPACSDRGIAVFNDPHSNTRSVAELVLGEIIMLARRVFDGSVALHQGSWQKSATGCHEVRGQTVGIVGYGKIGSQLSDLAEAIGMTVIFSDVSEVLARGNAKKVSFEELLEQADFVTLHVDGRPHNRGFFGADEFRLMKEGSYFMNLSRGFVVDHEALAENLRSGKLKGAAIDVFPKEPKSKGGAFCDTLQNLSNVILTPHIGGSTEEAQLHIAHLVSARIHRYVEAGDTILSVNFPHCRLERSPETHRLVHIHRNQPGMLLAINKVFGDREINVERQVLDTKGEVGYAILDINQHWDAGLVSALESIPHTIRSRALY